MCSAKKTLPGNLGTKRKKVNMRILQEKACREWGGWRAAFARGLLRGCFPLLECSREGSRGTKSCLWLSGGWWLEAHPLKWPSRPRAGQLVKGEVFPSVWSLLGSSAPGSGAWVTGFHSSPSLRALEEPQEETKSLVWRQPALSLFTSRGGLLCTATYLPEREGCSYNGDLTHCICFVLV